MKELLIYFCCLVIITGITGCNSMNAVSDENNNESTAEVNNSSAKLETDISNLFSDIQEIDSISTMRIDIQYTLDTSDQIDELIKRLEDIEYTDYDTEKSMNEAAPEDEATGSRTNGINLVFDYKNGSMKKLEFSSTEDGEFVKYVEVTYEPYKQKTRMYTTGNQVWNDLLVIMEKGEMKNLNEK